jgi:phenylpropionate dioxygenase-like ring-hydroxylating dioxygenase large terminal subunit
MTVQTRPTTPPAAADLAALVQPGRVHRSVYADPAIFELEMERIFGRAWLYACHDSQLPKAGSFVTATLGRQPVILARGRDGTVRGMFNRCTHRGAKLCTDDCGTVKRFVCCYHGWAFDPDGTLAEVPIPDGYRQVAYPPADGSLDLVRVPRVAQYRGFWFASLAADGPSLEEFLGPMTTSLDDMVDRSPSGTIEVAGGFSKHVYHGNWKLVLENHNDTLHPRFVHASSVAAARDQSDAVPTDGAGAVQIRQMRQNGAPSQIWEDLGIWGSDWGHAFMGDYHTDKAAVALADDDPVQVAYRGALAARVGEARAAEILAVSRFNTVVYPNLSFMSRFRQLRVVVPVAVDRTVLITHTFRMPGAPEAMFRESVAFANVVNGVGSLVLTDDLETYERVQRGLDSRGGEWVDIARGLGADQRDPTGMLRGATGTSEVHMRNQFAAWVRYMTEHA